MTSCTKWKVCLFWQFFSSGPFFTSASAGNLCVGKGDNEAQGSHKVSLKVLPTLWVVSLLNPGAANVFQTFSKPPFSGDLRRGMSDGIPRSIRALGICLRHQLGSFFPPPPPPSPQVKYLLKRMSGGSVWPQLPGFCFYAVGRGDNEGGWPLPPQQPLIDGQKYWMGAGVLNIA